MERENWSTVWGWLKGDIHRNRWWVLIVPVIACGWFLVEVIEYKLRRMFREVLKWVQY